MIFDKFYDADYFLRGKQTGKSLYEDYRWLPDLTIPMAQRIVNYCGIDWYNSILDFGCARGYTVRALRDLGYLAYGSDVSTWALDNCDPKVMHYVFHGSAYKPEVDWTIAKDVLEHIPDVADVIAGLMLRAKIGLFVVVPLSAVDGESYVVDDYELDVTHIHRLTLGSWVALFTRPGWSVEARYRVVGVKDNYAQFEKGNGFIVARRLGADAKWDVEWPENINCTSTTKGT